MDWKEEPATHQQLLRLQEYGFVPNCQLTVTQAARLIRQYSKHPQRPGSLEPVSAPVATIERPPPQVEEPSRIIQTRSERLGESARMHPYRLRLSVLAAERLAKETPDRPGVRADLHSTVAARRQFWLDTCRDPQDMHLDAGYAVEFYQHYGARFFPPTWEEVGEVLDALDGAMPSWDKDHPELFYETLKLNFPSLLRHK